jgi:hypothetical protein
MLVLQLNPLMDFEKNWEISSASQLPTTIQNLFFQTFRFQPLRKLSHTYYLRTSSGVALTLQNSIPQSSVFLWQRDRDSYVPGVSQLDFLLVKEKEITEKEIWDLRTDYFELKSKVPVLGSIILTQSRTLNSLERTDNATSHWFYHRKRFVEGKWKVRKNENFPLSQPLSRLALAVFHFSNSQKFLLKATRGNSSFYLANFYREVGRALFSASGEKLESLTNHSPPVLMAHVFFQLQTLSYFPWDGSRASRKDFKLEFPERNGARFSAEILNRSWLEKLKRMDSQFSQFRATYCPFILTPQSELNWISLVNLFSAFYQSLPSLGRDLQEVPLLLPEQVFEVMSVGWHWGESLEHLSWVRPAQLEDSAWVMECERATFLRLKERVKLERNLILGKLISSSPDAVQKALTQLAWGVLTLKAKQNLADPLLVERTQKDLPETSRVFRSLSIQPSVQNLQALLRGTLATLRESHWVVKD